MSLYMYTVQCTMLRTLRVDTLRGVATNGGSAGNSEIIYRGSMVRRAVGLGGVPYCVLVVRARVARLAAVTVASKDLLVYTESRMETTSGTCTYDWYLARSS